MSAASLQAQILTRHRARYVADVLTQQVEIWRPQRDVDAAGDTVSVLKQVGDALPGRVRQQGTAVELATGERVQSINNNAILLPWGTEIQTIDVLKTVGDGGVYSVQGTDAGRADALYLTVFVVQTT